MISSLVSLYGPSVTTAFPSCPAVTRRVCAGSASPCPSTSSPDFERSSLIAPMYAYIACSSCSLQAGACAEPLPRMPS